MVVYIPIFMQIFYIIRSSEVLVSNCKSKNASKVLPYHFRPLSVSNYSDNEESNSESETDIR